MTDPQPPRSAIGVVMLTFTVIGSLALAGWIILRADGVRGADRRMLSSSKTFGGPADQDWRAEPAAAGPVRSAFVLDPTHATFLEYIDALHVTADGWKPTQASSVIRYPDRRWDRTDIDVNALMSTSKSGLPIVRSQQLIFLPTSKSAPPMADRGQPSTGSASVSAQAR